MAANRLNVHELENLIRSAAMAPLSPETVRKALMEHQALLRRHDALEELFARLLPAWGECRSVLNEMRGELDKT